MKDFKNGGHVDQAVVELWLNISLIEQGLR
jgi:hypothetical protein